jgi:hypothetical protein
MPITQDLEYQAEAQSRNQFYGVNESNGLPSANYHAEVDYTDEMSLAEFAAQGGRITRLRILGGGPEDGFMCDTSYCHGTLPDGRTVPVSGGPMCFPVRRTKATLIEWAKEQGVFAKGLGLLDEGNWSTLR